MITTLLLVAIGFAAGFLDSIVGGGGLIATPALMNVFPQWQVLNVIGTNRISSIAGTSVAAWNYLRSLSIEKHILLPSCAAALICSLGGVQLAQRIPTEQLKTVIVVVIALLSVYSVVKKDLGLREERRFDTAKQEALAGATIGGLCGFYNGLIGPGTGTLLVFGFVSIVGFDFLKSSAISKAVNLCSDMSSWMVLFLNGFVIWSAAIPLIAGNAVGGFVGSRFAMLRGVGFIRWVFICIVAALLIRIIIT